MWPAVFLHFLNVVPIFTQDRGGGLFTFPEHGSGKHGCQHGCGVVMGQLASYPNSFCSLIDFVATSSTLWIAPVPNFQTEARL
jgi:hypothetical protein